MSERHSGYEAQRPEWDVGRARQLLTQFLPRQYHSGLFDAYRYLIADFAVTVYDDMPDVALAAVDSEEALAAFYDGSALLVGRVNMQSGEAPRGSVVVVDEPDTGANFFTEEQIMVVAEQLQAQEAAGVFPVIVEPTE